MVAQLDCVGINGALSASYRLDEARNPIVGSGAFDPACDLPCHIRHSSYARRLKRGECSLLRCRAIDTDYSLPFTLLDLHRRILPNVSGRLSPSRAGSDRFMALGEARTHYARTCLPPNRRCHPISDVEVRIMSRRNIAISLHSPCRPELSDDACVGSNILPLHGYGNGKRPHLYWGGSISHSPASGGSGDSAHCPGSAGRVGSG